MRRYETITIIDPDLSEEGRSPVLERVESLIPEQKGLLVETDVWGARKLAYEIKKKTRGYYVRFDYCGTGELVNEIERFFRIDDRVLKYMTVLLEESVDLDEIKGIIAAAAEARKAKSAAEAAAAEAPPAADAPAAAEAPPAAAPDEVESAAVEETESAEAQAEPAAEQTDTGAVETQPPAESAEHVETEPVAEASAETAQEEAPAEEPAAPQAAESDTDAETEKK